MKLILRVTHSILFFKWGSNCILKQYIYVQSLNYELLTILNKSFNISSYTIFSSAEQNVYL